MGLVEKYSCYEFEVTQSETGKRIYEQGMHGKCKGYETRFDYKIFGEGCYPYHDGVIESDEWFDSYEDAKNEAIKHIDRLESGE